MCVDGEWMLFLLKYNLFLCAEQLAGELSVDCMWILCGLCVDFMRILCYH